MKKYVNISIVLLISLILFGCERFLDEKPSKTSELVPSKIDELEALFNKYLAFSQEANKPIIFGTDDYGLSKELFDAKNSVFPLNIVEYATWDIENIASDDRSFWPSEWKKIFIANMVLSYLDKVTGDNARKQNLEAEAYFIRVYSYFVMANTFCLPYTKANKGELGLPIKTSTSFEDATNRATLEETWNFMKEDLEKALKLNVKLTKIGDKYKTWRASNAAVNAFASRFYMALNDYSKAQVYADKALQLHGNLVDYNTQMYYSNLPHKIVVDGKDIDIKYPYTHDLQLDPTDRMKWEELYYYRFLDNSYWWYVPSKSLLDLYDKNYDLRYKYHIVEDYSYDRGLISPAYSYPGYIFFHKSDIPSGPTTAEMLLIKGECQIRQGNWQAGLVTVNKLRAVRMDNTAPANAVNLTATGQQEALLKVMNERRRELPFSARWYDLRRYNNNENSSDDVVLKRKFYPYNAAAVIKSESLKTYSLPVKSRRYANPIMEYDITVSEGVLKQNKY